MLDRSNEDNKNVVNDDDFFVLVNAKKRDTLNEFIESVLSKLRHPSRELKEPPLLFALRLINELRFQKKKDDDVYDDFEVKQMLALEFGCYTGGTLRQIVENFIVRDDNNSNHRREVYGFDSFEGLPTDWYNGRGKGWFALGEEKIPTVEGARIVKGWFNDTVDPFFRNMIKKTTVIALVHVDSDLYSSAKTVLDALGECLRNNEPFRRGRFPLYIEFDELINYPEYECHEIKALYEFLLSTSDFLRCEVIGSDQRVKCLKPRFYTKDEPCDMRVLFKLTSI
jgi:hypothetical protein